MTENEDMPVPVPVPEQELPGKRLRAAREAAGLRREDVAAQLRLHVRLVTALEEDDYAALPGPTFTTGYLRNYARLLGLPEDAVLAPAKHQPPPLVSTSASVREISSRDGVARLATFLIIGVMLVAVAMWWLGRQEDLDTPESSPMAESSNSLGNLSPGEEGQSEEAPSPAQLGDTVSSMETQPPMVPLQEEPAEEGAQVEPEAVERMPSMPTEAAAPPVTAPAAPINVAPVAPPEPPPLTDAMPQSKLELRFDADSWTEVKDNAGRQLLYRLIQAGEVLVVSGEAPFHVFLGYAPGVSVYYNDELFDHSPFQRRDVARFRIGRAEHNHPLAR